MDTFFWGMVVGALVGLFIAGLCAAAGRSDLLTENEELRRENIALECENIHLRRKLRSVGVVDDDA
ncbi:hypothetical protein [Thermosinus carboxydivorans]|uniref:hypothetical protein n=1 Tax=Thermosinus carboxydivorans TaxID=261685 RepID=UPI0002F54DCD|nr:hypothetical protein [Thermosinus carboxydivorans]